jgi:prepilin-type N-terminal cleavage/methylation domain-containing protein
VRSDPCPAPNGFTLVEVLVALVVASLLLGIVMNGAVDARSRSGHAAQKRASILLARDIVSQSLVAPLREGTRTGAENDLVWRLEERIALSSTAKAHVLVEIAVEVGPQGKPPSFKSSARRIKVVPSS